MTHDQIGFAAALSAAAETGLFLELVQAARTPAEHARACKLDTRATARVLDVLVAHGFAVREGDTVRAAPDVVDSLERVPGGPVRTIAMWNHVREFLRTGVPFVKMDDAREASYATVVAALGRMGAQAADELAAMLPRAPAHVLDIGCGSGVWSLAIAKRHAQTRVTGLDLPAVLESFRARATEQGLADRIDTLPGDVHAIAIPRVHDFVVIANVLRIESPERARAIVQHAATALVPGGEILVVDALAGGTPVKERARTVYGLHLAMRTEHGRVYSPEEISGWLRDVGMREVQPLVLRDELTAGGLGALLAR